VLDPRGQLLRSTPRLLDSPPVILHQVPMRRIGLAVVLALALMLVPLAVEARQAPGQAELAMLTVASACDTT
jgi:hypothetical protein